MTSRGTTADLGPKTASQQFKGPATGDHAASADSSDCIISTTGAAAHILLNRPQKLNAVSSQMYTTIAAAIPQFSRSPDIYALIIRSSSSRAFCAGGDVREIAALLPHDIKSARSIMAAEYRLNWQLECFTKPTLALIDGLVMGSGVGLTLYGTHQIAGENYQFAMPETALGFFPDIGICSVFARLPHQIGMYLGLTGARLNRADAFFLGLVTHCIDAQKFDTISALVSDADPVDPVLDSRHVDPGASPLAKLAPTIERCFTAATVEDIIMALRGVRGEHQDWAEQTLVQLATAAPLSLKVTHRQISAAQMMDLRQALILDYRLAHQFFAQHDFSEGVRAALIDRDKKPQWSPATPEDVTDEVVDQYFTPMSEGELNLPNRLAMQTSSRK